MTESKAVNSRGSPVGLGGSGFASVLSNGKMGWWRIGRGSLQVICQPCRLTAPLDGRSPSTTRTLRFAEQAVGMGEIAALRFGPLTPAYVLNDPDVARSMLITEAKSWKRPPATVIPIRMALGENLFTQSERDWALLQPVLAPDFRKRALEPRLAEVPALVEEEVRRFRSTPTSTSTRPWDASPLWSLPGCSSAKPSSEVEPTNWSLING